MTNPPRTWLIAGLTHQPLPSLAEHQVAELVEAAENEGVLLLLEHQLQSHPEQHLLPDEFQKALLEAARPLLFDQMQMLAEQRRVFEVLQNAQVDFLVLKGGALAHWLYEKPHLRIVTDLDILQPNQQAVMGLESVLNTIGYCVELKTEGVVGYEQSYKKPGGPYGKFVVDAHWRLFNLAILHERFNYAELSASSIALPTMPGVRVLGVVHALFNACGHYAINLPFTQTKGLQNANCLRWLWDIHAMAQVLTLDHWQDVLRVADEKKLSAIVKHSLRMTQSVFSTQLPHFVIDKLAQQQKTEAMSIEWFTFWPRFQWHEFLASSPHWRGRFTWLGERIWPNPEAVRERYGSNDPAWKFMLKRLGAGIRRLFG